MAFAAVDQLDAEPDAFGAGQGGFEMTTEADEVDQRPGSPVKVPGTGGNPMSTGMGEASDIVGRRGGEESNRIGPLEAGDGGKPCSTGDPSGNRDAERAFECPLNLEHGGPLGRDPKGPNPVYCDRDEDPDQDDDQSELKEADAQGSSWQTVGGQSRGSHGEESAGGSMLDDLDQVPHRQEDAQSEDENHEAQSHNQDRFNQGPHVPNVVVHLVLVIGRDLVQHIVGCTGFIPDAEHLDDEGREEAYGLRSRAQRFATFHTGPHGQDPFPEVFIADRLGNEAHGLDHGDPSAVAHGKGPRKAGQSSAEDQWPEDRQAEFQGIPPVVTLFRPDVDP